MIANDQHQPASSRAIATFATAGRFFSQRELHPLVVQSFVAGLAT